MFVIIGAIIVLACVIGGYSIHGNIYLLFQPIELLIIGGAAVGAFIIQSPTKVLGQVVKNSFRVLYAKGTSKAEFLEILGLLNDIFTKMRKEGLIAIEGDIENPEQSAIFAKYPGILKNHHALNFICDNLKVIISTNVTPHELDDIMEFEIETHHKESMMPSHSIAKVADGLPALGIVAAVLGVVITMGKIAEPPEVLGESIGAALIGTFLGVLLSYGFVGPIATNLEYIAEEDMIIFQVIKIALVSFVGGAAPQIAVEFARRVIPSGDKPGFTELEESIR
ncbi:MAG TPA: flagellar motor stator protein MotA [Nitrospirae bacterium]|nr:motility protein A [bacterium BMS3Abin06]HDH13651.1 flagellar motor stator protein MotA [Nitrospirota bacterium]HDZ00893.1 flagellar motor stator protein MotA [Nitrospirota bacterium]